MGKVAASDGDMWSAEGR